MREGKGKIDTESFLASKFEVEDWDSPVLLLSCPSFTNLNLDRKYMITIDFSNGVVKCDCPDAVCRGKLMDILDGSGYSCKHMRACKPFVDIILKTGMWK